MLPEIKHLEILKDMKRLGTVLHNIGNQNLIVRGEVSKGEKPRINSFVMDKSVKNIGKILNYFGPVEKPYYVVRLNKGIKLEARHYITERLYVQ